MMTETDPEKTRKWEVCECYHYSYSHGQPWCTFLTGTRAQKADEEDEPQDEADESPRGLASRL